jgi:hypothetical protein
MNLLDHALLIEPCTPLAVGIGYYYAIMGKALSAIACIISPMCDYMYYEHKQRGKLKNLVPAEEPELEKAEEQPMTVNA